MKIGLQIPHFDWPGSPDNMGPVLLEMARAVDQGGFASLWVMDHLFGIGAAWGPAEAPMPEGYTTLSYMAAVTEHVRLGLMVTGAYRRYPGVLVKMVTTLDVLTGGRAYLGIGAGGGGREDRGLGVPIPPSVGERIAHLEEMLQIAKHMWRNTTEPFIGKYYQLEEPMNHPPPLSKPHPPILVGGGGEKQTLRLVATYGDACNFQLGAPLPGYPEWYINTYHQRAQVLPHKLAVLREHCQKVGRDYDEIEKTVLGSIQLAPHKMSTSQVIEVCHELAEMGFQQVIYNMPDAHDIEPIERVAEEIIPQVASF